MSLAWGPARHGIYSIPRVSDDCDAYEMFRGMHSVVSYKKTLQTEFGLGETFHSFCMALQLPGPESNPLRIFSIFREVHFGWIWGTVSRVAHAPVTIQIQADDGFADHLDEPICRCCSLTYEPTAMLGMRQGFEQGVFIQTNWSIYILDTKPPKNAKQGTPIGASLGTRGTESRDATSRRSLTSLPSLACELGGCC